MPTQNFIRQTRRSKPRRFSVSSRRLNVNQSCLNQRSPLLAVSKLRDLRNGGTIMVTDPLLNAKDATALLREHGLKICEKILKSYAQAGDIRAQRDVRPGTRITRVGLGFSARATYCRTWLPTESTTRRRAITKSWRTAATWRTIQGSIRAAGRPSADSRRLFFTPKDPAKTEGGIFLWF